MRPFLFLKVARVNFIPASVIPFLMGAVLAFRQGSGLSPVKFLLGLSGVISAHLAGNLFNEYFDDRSGADRITHPRSPFFGGSAAIQEGLVPAEKVLFWAASCMTVSLVCGASLFFRDLDPVFLLMMAVAAVLTAGYTAPPLRLAYKRLGEADIFFMFGIFPAAAGFYIFTGFFSLDALMLSLPISFMILAVIFCNEIPDAKTDTSSGKHNIISLAGVEKGYILYGVALALSYAAIALNAFRGIVHPMVLIVALAYFAGGRAAVILKRLSGDIREFTKASALTIFLHAMVGAVMIIGVLTAK